MTEPAGTGTTADRVRYHAPRVVLALALAVYTQLLFPASPAVDIPIYEVGSVASEQVIAPFAFRVMKSEADLQREAETLIQAIPPIYRYDPAALDSTRRSVDSFRTAVEAAIQASTDPRVYVPALQRIAETHGMSLTPAEAQYLGNARRRDDLFSAVARVIDRWMAPGVAPAGSLDDVRGDISLRRPGEEPRRIPAEEVVTFSVLMTQARRQHPDPTSEVGDALYVRFIAVFFRPTIVPDRVATTLEQDAVRQAIPVERFDVRAQEKIIGANEVVGRDEHEKLRALRDALESSRASDAGPQRVAGAVLFNLLVVVILGIALVKFRPQVYDSFRALITFTVIVALVVGGGAIVGSMTTVHPELIPIAFAAVLISALFDPRISMIAAMVLAALVGGQSVFRGTNALFINLIGGAVAAFSVRAISRRSQSYQWIVTIAGAYVVTALAIGLTLDLPAQTILQSAALGSLNAMISVVIALMLLPMAEAFTGVETDLTLLEWSDLNRPLLQRLSLEAPGTYAHTIAIANLAEAACRAIGANALLARVGAYYHDIGKIARPQYFVENQPKGRNPHDVMHPADSAAIIRDHVSAGLALAEKHRIPRALRAFITEHHGTGAISYFYEKAKDADGSTPDPAGFAYPGPLPRTAETAVVMLADGVEAATRVLADPTPEKIREVVNHIVRQRIDQGQMDDAPLTLSQIETVKFEFARVLSGMYHNRIDYPAASGGVSAEFASVPGP